ncbi:hypothetical protein KSF_058740 [Reticulibacter mediterranei]|uniref:Uncharacterized protein n=1 Tax=Reticulibacter mediterranei TaxID=2778369 RepID=A0A8J3IV48_9CHLR|nr:hypothetical protein [Reticulibacter mediterranei]GHO95826.1 hypothetical protein KSF_058740 [Reticulibacter mediterranei]
MDLLNLEAAVTSLFPRHGKPTSLSSLAFFLHVQERQQIFEALARSQREEQLWEEAHALLSTSIEHMLTAEYTGKWSPELPVEVVAHYLTGAFLMLPHLTLPAEVRNSYTSIDRECHDESRIVKVSIAIKRGPCADGKRE